MKRKPPRRQRPKFNRRPHQMPMTAHMLRHPMCNVFASLGSGKTGSVLWVINWLFTIGKLRKGVDRVLVVAPLRVATISWPDEVDGFHWANLSIAVAVGTAPERLAALRSDANIVTINYDVLPWLEEQEEADTFTVIVADECTRLSGFRGMSGKAAQSKALARIVKRNKPKRHINLTATPGSLLKQWGMMWFLDRGTRLGASFKAFTDKWFESERVGKSEYAVKLTPSKHAFKQIMKRISDISLTVDAVKIFGVDKPAMLDYWVKLPPAARAVYDELERDSIVELRNGDIIDAVNAGAKLGKCLQMAQGACYVSDEDGDATKEWTHLHDAKLEALAEIEEKIDGANMVIVYQFRHDLERILKAFPDARHLDSKGDALKAWNAGKLNKMVLHAQSAGHGLSLQGNGRPESGGYHMVFFGCGWSPELYQQTCGRINPMRQKQSGYTDRVVYYHHIRARDTWDEAVKQVVEDGVRFEKAILDYCERHE